VVAESGVLAWRRADAVPPPEMETLRVELQDYARTEARTVEELIAFVEAGIERLRPALAAEELAFQRGYKWRPFLASCALIRVPADGRWDGARLPAACAAPPAPAVASADDALDAVVRWHLRAFGPAAAEDVAGWIGWRTPQVRAAFERLELARFRDEAGRALFDLAGAPRPDPGVPAPNRLLPWFDSVLLAYAPQHPARILPDAYRDRVYVRANLQWLPTFLVDGLVAGTWSIAAGRREATLTLQPFAPLPAAVRRALVEEAERLVRFARPGAARHGVAVV
jgi:hypothetical protein